MTIWCLFIFKMKLKMCKIVNRWQPAIALKNKCSLPGHRSGDLKCHKKYPMYVLPWPLTTQVRAVSSRTKHRLQSIAVVWYIAEVAFIINVVNYILMFVLFNSTSPFWKKILMTIYTPCTNQKYTVYRRVNKDQSYTYTWYIIIS